MKSIISIISIFTALNSFAATRPVSQRETNFDQFLNAIAKVESNNNAKAIGDNGRSLGVYQIQKACYLDAKRFDRSINFNYESITNKNNSKKILIAYLNRHCSGAIKGGNFEIMARTWNGGPKGINKKSTLDYWLKVKKHLK